MNILLDYLFPITAIEPTPAASTAFLKQVCLVVKPAAEVETGVITLCTSMSAVAALTDNEEAQQLFNAGMNRVYILPMDDLDLADALEGHESDFFTLLISSDFSDAEIEAVVSVAAVKAQVKIQDILFVAKTAGIAGNSITIDYNTGGTAGSESVNVVGSAIEVVIEDGVSTAQEIADAIEASGAAAALVEVVVDEGDETDPQEVFGAAVPLAGGVAQVNAEDGMDVGAFKGVVGLSTQDGDFAAEQAAIANRAAMQSSTATKAKNLLFAFGKLLANALSWNNQQYITMPFSDDVANLGDANALFDDKISFVISDTQYSNRLALLAAGGKAIVAPYIIKNLQVDIQSAALSYIAANQPGYTLKHAALLEDELQKVVQLYITRQWIESGSVAVSLEQDNFVASGRINVAEPKAMWRIFGEMRQS